MAKPIKASDRDKPWFKSRTKTVRPFGISEERQRILIVCEGEKTEPNYFKAFFKKLPQHSVQVEVEGLGDNTLSLVKKTQETRDKSNWSQYPFDQTWVVFDRDSFPPDQFDNAINKAEADNIKCAWSNEAFELWFLLHFEDRQIQISREEFKPKLTKYLGKEYQKNDPGNYGLLLKTGSQSEAIKRAKALDDLHTSNHTSPNKANPCTKVYLLVSELNRFIIPT